jgi:3-phenylpropionate/trans-cinnamate dioxygenase ferredoxin reductase subunit
MADDRTFVIIGASLAGSNAAQTLREEGFEGRIILVGDETDRPYERPPLSKGYLLGKDPRDVAFLHEVPWYTEQNIELLLGVTATALDLVAHTVTIDDYDVIHYDKLLLATGSRVRTLNLPGIDNTGIVYLRTITQADALNLALREGLNVVIVGAGWIGLEVAAAARERGAQVTVIEMDHLPLRRVLGDEVATVFANLHRAHGVTFHFGAQLREFGGAGGHLTHVVLEDGTEIPADLAVIGVGIRPAVELADSGGLHVDNGVVVDASLRTSHPDVYACGDVANAYNPLFDKQIRVEHWGNALEGGKAAARSMLGQELTYDRVPYFYSDQYTSSPLIGMEYGGFAEPGGYDQVVFRGDPTIGETDPEFIAFWVKDSRVVAGMNVNVWDVNDAIQDLVRAGQAGRSVDLDKLADPGVPLGDLLS